MLIGISGKKQSGKDTVGKIIKALTFKKFDNFKLSVAEQIQGEVYLNHDWEIRKFADKLKDMVCILLSCTREQLEDESFKNTELGKNWNYFTLDRGEIIYSTFLKKEDAIRKYEHRLYSRPEDTKENFEIVERFLTPRKILQLLGSECGRDIIHPNIWVNSLMGEYNKSVGKYDDFGQPVIGEPDWIVTDVRFPNEAEAIKDQQGILIRIESDRCNTEDTHQSETSLDNYKEFDYIIYNNDNIEQLVEEVKNILLKEKLL